MIPHALECQKTTNEEVGVDTTFRARLDQACDDSPSVPEKGKGRQVVIANAINVTQEAVRKWFAGESTPRPSKMRELAKFLEVDEGWLALGIKPELDRKEKRRAAMNRDGAVYLVAGLILLEGGSCAFPAENDKRGSWVDLYSIIRGQQVALHISLARAVSDNLFEVIVPRQYDDVTCIAVIPIGVGEFKFIQLPAEQIEQLKTKKAGDFALTIERAGTKFLSNGHPWPRFKTFGEIHG
nr:helix-turn-helix transcriptional regulator [Pseudomonas aeruginosa]